jgi:hypothetical protein
MLHLKQSLSYDSFKRGVSFTGFSSDAFLSDFSNQSLEQLADDGGEWVAINFFWFIDDLNSTTIYPDFEWYSVSNESIIVALAKAKELGLKTMLKPMIDTKSGDWRAYIDPTPEWFTAYKAFIVSWARFAEEQDLDLLSIGCEFSLSESNTAAWEDIINGDDGIRSVYSGELTYAANFDAYETIEWWDSLDYIGVDAYFQLTNKNNPSLDDLVNAWSAYSSEFNSFSNLWDKKIIFTEIGYRSIDGCNRWPWNWEIEGKLDLEEQRLCYEALFRALWGLEWFEGIFWWDWTPYEADNWLKNKDYTCQFKPAEEVLRAWYQEDYGEEPNYSYTPSVKNNRFSMLYFLTIVIPILLRKKRR